MLKKVFQIITVMVLCLMMCGCSFFKYEYKNSNKNSSDASKTSDLNVEKSKYRIENNSISSFDLRFLQLENKSVNKIYSPLSIKYALKMLEEGTTGVSNAQIKSLVGDYNAKKYINSKNLSLANALFIKDTYKSTFKTPYIYTLSSKYNALAKLDSFKSPKNVNSWVDKNTLGLIKNPFDDISGYNFLLINALAIDMEWEEKFIPEGGMGVSASYYHENFYWSAADDVKSTSFSGMKKDISGMEIAASFNNYDIVKTLGEDKIRKIVTKAYMDFLKENPSLKFGDELFWDEDSENLTGQQKLDKYLDMYIKELDSNYKAVDKSTDFSFYIDNDVKVFSKDLKKYNDTHLQYVAIMPTKQNLNDYINNVSSDKISFYINNLKSLKCENFKDGVVTKVTGMIPKFKFDYELDLMKDLQNMGVKNVFEQGKASLTNITSDTNAFIGKAAHKANIEFTQDGIKASAATFIGGLGAGDTFDYYFDVPVEEIDLTFDKPYMFLIKDKNSGDVWFVGTVYNPLLYSDDKTSNQYYIY